ncbi:MAG: hypothetical protein J6T51_05450 [Kiritimatiellae bacterium]|nr:hypothetical protein [Kiritimatiellia bacterium]
MKGLRQAFTLMEVNLAIFVMASGILAMVSLYSLGFRENTQSEEDVAAAGLADVFLAPLVAKLSDTNLTWDAWCDSVGSGGTGTFSLSPASGWEAYVQHIGGSDYYRVRQDCNGIADGVVGDIMGADTSGSEFSYSRPSDSDCYYGLVAARRGSTISLAFRASRRPQSLLSQPVFYTEVHFQGKASR